MRIKKLREARDWTQQELATRLGVSRVHVANLEAPDTAPHHRAPSVAILEKLARTFAVSVDYLLSGKGGRD